MTEPLATATAPIPPTPTQVRRIFTATAIIGVPGSGKTTLFDGFACYLWETFHKVLALYSWDGGAIPTQIQKRMQQGLIRFWRARTRSAEGLGIETVYLASKGYWPRKIDPLTGETSPAVELVAPVTTRYFLSCPQGHDLGMVTALALVQPTYCTSCKAAIDRVQLKVREQAVRTPGFEQIGGVGFDGLTSMSNVVMEHMDQARGHGQIGGEKPAFGGIVQSGGIKMGGNNRADVGFGQSRAQQFVNNSLSIPYLVEGPIFTALSMEATDEGGLSIVGMKLPGRAATDEASAWFGNVAEMGKTTDDAGKAHFTLFLRPFTDPQGRRHLLKTSASPQGLPDKLVDPPEEMKQAGLVANLGDVFRQLDADLARALTEEDIKDAPGIASAPGEYGEPAVSGQVAAAAPAQVGQVSMPASGIAPLQVPQPVATVGGPVAGGPQMVARRKPKPQTEASAAAAAPEPAGAVAPAPTPAPVAAAPVVTPSSGTTPPPPPGMRPPQRAPGS